MASNRTRALDIARNAQLVHPDLPLVEAFLHDAVDGERAAEYLLQAYAHGSRVDFTRFLDDWKDLVKLFAPYSRNLPAAQKKQVARRDAYRCCLTGKPCRFWNRWDVFPIIPQTALCIREPRLYDMLGAFTSAFHRDLLEDQTLENQARNRWTLSKDVGMFFSTGAIRVENNGGTKYDFSNNHIADDEYPSFYTIKREDHWECNLADHSKSGIESPDPDLLDISSRFSRSLKWTEIATRIMSRPRLRQSQITESSPFKRSITSISLAIWSRFPSFIRFQTYRLLRTAGSYIYGTPQHGVQRLPFGMYLKYGPRDDGDCDTEVERHAGEFNALKVVRSQTSIPVPYPIDHLVSPAETFLVTSRIKGEYVGSTLDASSDEEIQQMARELRSWIAELRSIKRSTNSEYAITDATGGPILDYRINVHDPRLVDMDARVGPFHSEKEFSELLRGPRILPGLMHRTDHEIVFTHGDLNTRNILAKDGRFTGIVDWENAGFFPDYWEYTKCYFCVKAEQRWLKKVVDAAFEHKYAAELAIEMQYWDRGNGISNV